MMKTELASPDQIALLSLRDFFSLVVDLYSGGTRAFTWSMAVSFIFSHDG